MKIALWLLYAALAGIGIALVTYFLLERDVHPALVAVLFAGQVWLATPVSAYLAKLVGSDNE